MTQRPQGRYKGTVLPPFSFLNRIWTGKVFEGYTVTNTIFGRQMIIGRVRVEEEPTDVYVNDVFEMTYVSQVVRIYYMSGLVDTLRPCWRKKGRIMDTLSDEPFEGASEEWHGTMKLFGITVHFVLEK